MLLRCRRHESGVDQVRELVSDVVHGMVPHFDVALAQTLEDLSVARQHLVEQLGKLLRRCYETRAPQIAHTNVRALAARQTRCVEKHFTHHEFEQLRLEFRAALLDVQRDGRARLSLARRRRQSGVAQTHLREIGQTPLEVDELFAQIDQQQPHDTAAHGLLSRHLRLEQRDCRAIATVGQRRISLRARLRQRFARPRTTQPRVDVHDYRQFAKIPALDTAALQRARRIVHHRMRAFAELLTQCAEVTPATEFLALRVDDADIHEQIRRQRVERKVRRDDWRPRPLCQHGGEHGQQRLLAA